MPSVPVGQTWGDGPSFQEVCGAVSRGLRKTHGSLTGQATIPVPGHRPGEEFGPVAEWGQGPPPAQDGARPTALAQSGPAQHQWTELAGEEQSRQEQ